MELPLAAVERISKKAGAGRISAQALREIRRVIEDIGLEIALDAAQAARHAKRKTILKEDVYLASGKVKL